MSGRTCLIDADGLIYIISYCKQKKDENGMSLLNDLGQPDREIKSLEDCKASMDDIIKNIILGSRGDSYLLFLTKGRNFRYSIYPEYKANRKYSDKPQYFDEIKNYLMDEYKAIYHPDLEADDLCLIYSKNIGNSYICSPDKDMMMLEGSHYNYNKGKWISVTKSEAEEFFWTSMITGDTADNIKGIPGKGPAFVKKLFSSKIQGFVYEYQVLVFDKYLEYFGEELGIYEFYKNYGVLKIKDKHEGLVIANPIKFGVKDRGNELQEEDTW